jgi:pyridoxal phosphate enzyme (YggS family)
MIAFNLERINKELPSGVKLVAVSKFHPFEAILEAYNEGQRAFGENRPQEFAAKAVQLPQDIEWHFIGHLQTNKLKLVLPYAYLVESIDTLHLLEAVNNWGEKNGKVISVLLEVHIGAEETKQGFTPSEVKAVLQMTGEFPYVRFRGLMGMASHTDDEDAVAADFAGIKSLFDECRGLFPTLDGFDQLSIGMSDDWPIAVRHGSTEVRIGTAIFGNREY